MQLGKYDKNIIYKYKFYAGGLADFIKFFFLTLYFGEKYEANVYLEICHPIICSMYVKEPYIFRGDNSSVYEVTDKDRGADFKKLLEEKKNISMISNWFFEIDMKFEYINDCVLQTLEEVYKKAYNYKDYFDFSESIYNKLKSAKPPCPYECVHIRFGDMHLEKKPDHQYCNGDNRFNNTIGFIESNIKNLKNICQNEGRKLFVLSDKLSFNQYINQTNPEVGFFNQDAINISYPHDYMNMIPHIESVVVEFLFLMGANKIHAMSPSGFTSLSSAMGKVPLIKYY